MATPTLAPTARVRLPLAIPGAIALAWLLALAAEAWGRAGWMQHDSIAEGGLPRWDALVLFLVSWQLMVIAMMLPTAFPMLKLFEAASRDQDDRRQLMTAFLAPYLLLWGAFGLVALIGDFGLHRLVDAWPLLRANEWVIAPAALALAGAFQFSSLKDRCLRECRHPAAFLLQHYRRGSGAAFKLGLHHGAFCLGCCWALMLLMFAVGMANLWWMAALTALMAYEKIGRHGELVAKVAGVDLLLLSAVIAAYEIFA